MAYNSCPFSSRRNCGSSGGCGRRGPCGRRVPTENMFGMNWNDWALQLSLLADHNSERDDEKQVETKVPPIRDNGNKFEIKLDVSHFSPEEFIVKIVDNYIVIECKHEEKKDEYGWISRQMTRKFSLPDDVDIEKVHSSLSSNGILTVEVPKKIFKSKEENVILIPVIHEKVEPLVNNKDSNDSHFEVIDKVDDVKTDQKQEQHNN